MCGVGVDPNSGIVKKSLCPSTMSPQLLTPPAIRPVLVAVTITAVIAPVGASIAP